MAGGTLGLALLALLVLLGAGLPKILLGILLAGGAVLAFLKPEIGLYALLLNALVGLSHIADLPRIGPLSVPVALEMVLLIAVAARAASGRKKLFIASPQHLLVLGLALWLVLSLLYNGRVGPSNLLALRNEFLVRVLVLFLLTNILLTREALRRLAVILMVCNAGLLATSFLVRWGFFGIERINLVERSLVRTSGLVHNPNALAFDLTFMLIFAVAGLLYVRHPALRAALAILAACDILGIVTTLSRSGFVSLAAVILFLLWKLRRSWKGIAVAAAMGLLILVAMPWELSYRFGTVDAVRDVNRLGYARVGLEMAMGSPVFGVGLGNYEEAFEDHNVADLDRFHPPHNMYMDLAAQAGFPALAIYVLIFWILWSRLRAMERDLQGIGDRGSFLYIFGWSVQAALVNLAVFGLSGDVEFEYSVFTVLGFGMLLYREHRQGSSGEEAA